MSKSYYMLVFIALCIIQVLLNNYLNVSQYLLLSLMPLALMSIPLNRSTISCLLIAFFTGLAVDVISTPSMGSTSIALLVCAMIKNFVFQVVYGDEIFSLRDSSPLVYTSGKERIISTGIMCGAYFLFYIIIDSAGTMSFTFNLLRWLYSTMASTILCCLCAVMLFRRN